MVLSRLSSSRPSRLEELSLLHLRKSTALAVLLALPVAAACGGKSEAEKAKEALAQAHAACGVFANFKPPTGATTAAQIAYAKASAKAFSTAAQFAKAAAADDPQWAKLASSAKAEADSYAVIVKASTEGFTSRAGQDDVYKAVEIAKNARPVFIAQCTKVDPKNFTTPPSSTPSPSARPRHAPRPRTPPVRRTPPPPRRRPRPSRSSPLG